MRYNTLKPRQEALVQNLSSYRTNSSSTMDGFEFETLSLVCVALDRAIRTVTRSALEQLPKELKENFIISFTPSAFEMPMATSMDSNTVYRISIPISFIHRLLSTAATRSGLRPSDKSDYYLPSVFVATLAAYAHELNHIFTGHLTTPSSSAQEANSDLRGGALTWAWLQREDIRDLCQISKNSVEHDCVYGFLHLVSILSEAKNLHSSYPPRIVRHSVYCTGAAKFSDSMCGKDTRSSLIEAAIAVMPTCPDSQCESTHINAEYHAMSRSHSEEDLIMCIHGTNREVQTNKSFWYRASEHLRPIRRGLMRILKQAK